MEYSFTLKNQQQQGKNSFKFFESMNEKKNISTSETSKPPSGGWGFIIPAIDIIEGKCVRLTKGDYEQKKIYNENPLEVAKEFEDAGLQRLHLVDLDGAKAGEVKNWKVLEQIASKTELVIDFSGGISTKKNVSICFDSGASLCCSWKHCSKR